METLWSAFLDGGYDRDFEDDNCIWNIYDRSNHLLCKDYGHTTGGSDLINELDKHNVYKITTRIKDNKHVLRVVIDARYSLADAHIIAASAEYRRN